MNNILKKICEDKKLELEILKKKCSLNSLKKLISDQINKRDFKNVIIKSVEERKNFIIGEIKKASPSAGEIIHNYEPIEIAKIYERAGVKALSILTEKKYFKGEIDHLSKMVKPNIGVITNITYAHSQNFNNLFGIAKAKSEIIDNIIENGSIVLNADDKFYNYFKLKAKNKSLKIISFSRKNKSNIKLEKIKSLKDTSTIKININGRSKKFVIKRNLEFYIENILASLAVISNYLDLNNINDKFFFNYNLPEGRGDYKYIKINKKKIHLIDESYNSNPLSLKFALKNFSKLHSQSKRKIILLGDMLELGKFSKKLHLEAAKMVNNTSINSVYVFGKKIIDTFNKIRPQKRGKILYSIKDVSNFLKNDIKNGEYLMIKGSNSTGLNNISKKLRLGKINAI